ncbi:hypothetical protein ACQRUO_39230, partial [Kitasatospora sp. LaBMicrA B282]
GAVAGGGAAAKPGAGLPPVRPVEERVPPGLWRPEPAEVDATRPLPAVAPGTDEPTRVQPAQPSGQRPPRPSWAEETPMDDLPTLTDSLLGSREEWARWEDAGGEDEDPGGGREHKRRK